MQLVDFRVSTLWCWRYNPLSPVTLIICAFWISVISFEENIMPDTKWKHLPAVRWWGCGLFLFSSVCRKFRLNCWNCLRNKILCLLCLLSCFMLHFKELLYVWSSQVKHWQVLSSRASARQHTWTTPPRWAGRGQPVGLHWDEDSRWEGNMPTLPEGGRKSCEVAFKVIVRDHFMRNEEINLSMVEKNNSKWLKIIFVRQEPNNLRNTIANSSLVTSWFF